MTRIDQDQAFMTKAANVAFGRNSDIDAKTPYVRYWHKADQVADRRFVRSGLIADIATIVN